MPRPNFFIIGAPKCGTTALSEYLRGHPSIEFSSSKEPHYFCTDFEKFRFANSEAEYLDNYFSHCSGQEIAIGEGSVHYLFSDTAIQNILEFNPSAKFIVMLRNPVEMVRSLHNQFLLNLDEDVSDFMEAWNLQNERSRSNRIPPLCREPRFLQYELYGQLGRLTERFFGCVPKNQRLVIIFDDLISDPLQVYLNTLEFLGASDDGRRDFTAINTARANRSKALARFGHRPPGVRTMNMVNGFKRLMGIKKLDILPRVQSWINRLNTGKTQYKQNDDRIASMLKETFREDVSLLETLINRDLAHWLQ